MEKELFEGRLQALSAMIGNTPLLEIHFKYKGEDRKIYAKAEYYNLTGSIKDRMAFHMIKEAYHKGVLKPGYKIAEATSGNTGIAVSALGRNLGNEVAIFMPDWMSEERKKIIRSYGAEIHLVSREEGGFLGSIDLAEKMATEDPKVFLTNQFSNEDNSRAHYLSTAQEIWNQLEKLNLTPDGFVAGVGTGGTVMGVGKFLKEKNKNIRVYPLEPSSSPTLSTGHRVGKHRIQGISDEFIPSIVDLAKLDDILGVDDGDAINMAQQLASVLGLGVGISSGANMLGAILAQNKLGSDKIITTVFSDDNKKYLSTDLMEKEPVKDHFLSPDVELIDVISHKRDCKSCKAASM